MEIILFLIIFTLSIWSIVKLITRYQKQRDYLKQLEDYHIAKQRQKEKEDNGLC